MYIVDTILFVFNKHFGVMNPCIQDRPRPSALPGQAIRALLSKHLWYVGNHLGHSGSAWASIIPFQNKRIDSPRTKAACFSSFYVKIQTVSDKIKNFKYWETCWCVSHFRSKWFTVCALGWSFFVTQFVEGQIERRLVDDAQWTYGPVFVSIAPLWKVYINLRSANMDNWLY